MPKGLELPVSKMIAIVLVIIILVAVISLLIGITPIREYFVIEGAFRSGCSTLVSAGCGSADAIKVKVGEVEKTLLEICRDKFAEPDMTDNECKKSCGC